MSREWKPGDVAMVTSVNGEVDIALAVGDGDEHSGWRISRATFWGPKYVTAVRPLVVIDPEDREQVERLARVTHVALTGDVPAWFTLTGKDQVRRMDALTMALDAELAPPKPPKPEEPQGLGAVVEDADGRKWVRRADVATPVWVSAAAEVFPRSWDRINAVKVLSPGWSE